jgi:hypothetical protein
VKKVRADFTADGRRDVGFEEVLVAQRGRVVKF